MPPLRFFGSLVIGRLSWHRIRAGSAWLTHQSRNIADHVRGFGSSGSGSFPKVASCMLVFCLWVPYLVPWLEECCISKKMQRNQQQAMKLICRQIFCPDILFVIFLTMNLTLVLVTACGLTDEDATTAREPTDEDPTMEADLKARFEEWMIKYKRRYKDEEEKALRFREFKRHVKDSEKANALGSGFCTFEPNSLGDQTEEEGLMRRTGSYDMTARRYIARQRDMVYQRVLEWWYQL